MSATALRYRKGKNMTNEELTKAWEEYNAYINAKYPIPTISEYFYGKKEGN